MSLPGPLADLAPAIPHAFAGLVELCGRNAPLLALAASFLESLIGLGVLFPGGTAVILAAFAARSAGAAGFAEVALGAWLGMTLGSSVDYWLGRAAGKRLVPRRAPWRLALRWRKMLRASHRFLRRYGWWTIIAANLAGPGRAAVATAAGASRWSFGSFLSGQAVASAAWSSLYCGIGFFAAGEQQRLAQVVTGTGVAVAALLTLAIAGPSLLPLLTRTVRTFGRPAAPVTPPLRRAEAEATPETPA